MKREDIPKAVQIDERLKILEEYLKFPDQRQPKVMNIVINHDQVDQHYIGHYDRLEKAAAVGYEEIHKFLKIVESAYLSLIEKKISELKHELTKL